MAEQADIVIIGGGVIGTSIAYQLAKRGEGKRVLILEKERVASGSTSAAGGGIRSQFTTEINIRFSLASVKFWRRFEEEMGGTADYREDGYMFLARTAEERAQFEKNIALQNSFGVPVRLLEPDDAKQIAPWLRTDDLSGVAYNPEDAQAGPNEATQAYAKKAREGGVRIREGVTVTAIDTAGGRINGVETNDGRIETRTLVNCAGPWAGQVGELAGVAVPVRPYRRTVFISEPFDQLPPRFPLLIDLQVGWSVKREGAGLYMTGTKDKESSFNRSVNWDGLPIMWEVGVDRVPVLEHARFGKKAYAGLYDVSPDNHAIMCAMPGLEGLYLACGFSGHGFQHSPAAGRLMAELLLDGRTTDIDISPLSVTRFATGSLLREPLQAHVGAIGG